MGFNLGLAEFAFNSMVNRSTGHSPFTIVYTKAPNSTVDLITLPKSASKSVEQLAEQIQQLHQECCMPCKSGKPYHHSGLIKQGMIYL